MNKYNAGKIYIIRSPNTSKYYVGCTIKSLDSVLKSYIRCYSNNKQAGRNSSYISVFKVIKEGNPYIQLYDETEYIFNNKYELEEERNRIINRDIEDGEDIVNPQKN